jgi:hypothetical protein
MKHLYNLLRIAMLFSVTSLTLSSCSDDGPSLTGDSQTFVLNSVSNPNIAGTVTFAERDDSKTLITVQMIGTQPNAKHPAHIHANTAAEGGGIVLDLTDVNGSTGKSETVVGALNDGTVISYDDLINFDGYVNVHASATDLGTLVGQGDIGQNTLTGDAITYPLGPVSNNAISGTATFAKRANGETLVTIALAGTGTDGNHPAHIHAGAAAQGGAIMIDLTNVSGATGKSSTNVTKLNSGTAITYDELVNYNGYINVHLSPTSLSTLIAQGDIGQNELTGTKKVYNLTQLSSSGVSGTVTFAERKSGFTLITVSLTGTTPGATHPSHIHANNAATGGPIVLDFTSINGTTGKSVTHVTKLKSGEAITYAQLIAYNGYVNVHLSPTALSTLIAQGNIGSNAP